MSIVSDSNGGLRVEQAGGIVRLVLDRPKRRNALSYEILLSLSSSLDAIAQDVTARVVILGGEGPVFSAGHDLGEMVGRSESEYRALFRLCSDVMLKFRRLPQPVIARVQGHAVAAGCQLVATCDLAVAVDTATFSTPGVKIGLFCTTPAVALVRAVPPRLAMDMLLTGRSIPAAEALAAGLVNRVVAPEALDRAVMEMAEPILAASPLTVRLGKAAVYEQLALAECEAYSLATDVMTDNALRGDAQEGMTAFLHKRTPHWRGA